MIDVVCAIIRDAEGKVLVAQRSGSKKQARKMEFPGGKIEAGETPEAALVREIREELNLDIQPGFPMSAHEHHYTDLSIRLIPFVCHIIGGTLKLNEHMGCWWFEPSKLQGLDWAAADVPILENYLASL